MPTPAPRPRFFSSPARLRAWFERNHDKVRELWIGYYKKASGKGGVTYPQALDEALCYGWIDGVARSIDETTYCQRFTPRTARSYWSNVNIAKAKALLAAGRMMPAGLTAFERRDEKAAARYSFEAANPAFDTAREQRFRRNRKAWTYFSARPPGYRRTMTFWVMSAKRDTTRDQRLATLIEYSARQEPIPLMAPQPKKKKPA